MQAANAKVVFHAIAGVKDASIESVVSALNPDEMDVLMKYVYKGLEGDCEPSSGSLFKWHAQLVDKSGLGCIVRSMTDRKTV